MDKFSITLMNQITGQNHAFEIDSLNYMCTTMLGGTGGHTYIVPALKEICSLLGYSTAGNYTIDLLNTICTGGGGTGGHTYEYEAWYEIQQGSLLNLKAPTNLAAYPASDSVINVDFTVNDTGAEGHRIYISTDNITFTESGTVSGATATYSATGLTASTMYYFKAVAYKGAKESDFSNTDYGFTTVGLTNYRAAQAALKGGASTIYDINFVGDSITEGQYLGTADQIHDDCFVGKLKTYYANKYGSVGRGASHILHWKDVPLFVRTAGWVANDDGIKSKSYYSITLNDTLTITFKGTACSLLVRQYANFGVTIDGGSETLYNPGWVDCSKLSIASGLTDAEHTIVVRHNATTLMNVTGIYITGGTRGFRCNNLGLAGLIVQLDQNTKAKLWSTLLNPTLTIIASVSNEIIAGFSQTDYKTWMQATITTALATGDVLLVADNVLTSKTALQQDPYITSLEELAATNGIHLVNIYEKWGTPNSPSEYMYDTVHPNAAGHNDIYNEILKVLK